MAAGSCCIPRTHDASRSAVHVLVSVLKVYCIVLFWICARLHALPLRLHGGLRGTEPAFCLLQLLRLLWL
jgi:hypothetical protein